MQRFLSWGICFVLVSCGLGDFSYAQQGIWGKQTQAYYTVSDGSLIKTTFPTQKSETVLAKSKNPDLPQWSRFDLSPREDKVLLYTNDKRVYHNTYSICYVYDLSSDKLIKIGQGLEDTGILNAKFSPDGNSVAYVYNSNIYLEDLRGGHRIQLTHDGDGKNILNGWFDYVYSEELFLTDGFQWSPDGQYIAFWKLDISKVPVHHMVNNTDQTYPQMVSFAFSKPGQPIAAAQIGLIRVGKKEVTYLDLPGAMDKNYIPLIGWHPNSQSLLVQQLNRRQNESRIFNYSITDKSRKLIYEDKDDTWIDIQAFWMRRAHQVHWVDDGKGFIWASEKEGWRKLYYISYTGEERVITKDDFDVMRISAIDQAEKLIYFIASPEKATQRYLYVIGFDGKNLKKLTSDGLEGTNNYNFSPDARWALHDFSSHRYLSAAEWLKMPEHSSLDPQLSILKNLKENPLAGNIEMFTVVTADGVEMDGWMIKPSNFDPSKKYPVIFNVYSEPAGTTVNDVSTVGTSRRGSDFFDVEDGYIFMSVEGRGTPIPKGRAWRKAIYGNLGWINVIDQAGAAKEIIKWPFVDQNRVAVFGGSGGGSTTLHLLFRYPGLYTAGLASAGVPSHFVYNSFYQEKYLGLLPESRDNYLKGSAVTYAKGLEGALLIIHGTGDHNVHYQGEEVLLNELIMHNRQFMFMPYPNRGHGITEGEGTLMHRKTMYSNFLKTHVPPGGVK